MTSYPALNSAMPDIMEAIKTPNTTILWLTIAPVGRIRRHLEGMASNLGRAGMEVKLDAVHHTIRFPEGAMLIVASALCPSVVDKLRGLRLSMALIDSDAVDRAIVKELIDDVIVPRLLAQDGKIYYV